MFVIGLTGGIASGKSTVAGYFRERGVPVLDADVLGHRTYEPGTDAYWKVVEAFGSEVVAPDGTIDRKVLGAKVFGKPEELKRLTDIVWPAIRRLASEELSELEAGGNELAVLEAAVLLEAGWEDLVDEIWAVVVRPELAVARLRSRNGLDEAAAWARIRSQLSNEERVRRAHVVIENDGTLEELRHRFEEAWKALLERTRAASGGERG